MKTARKNLSETTDAETLKRCSLELETLRQQHGQADARFRRFEALLRILGEAQRLFFRETDRPRILRNLCNLLVEKKHYQHAWILLLDEKDQPGLAAQAGLTGSVASLTASAGSGDWPACLKNAREPQSVWAVQDPAFVCGPCALSPECQRHAQLVANIGYSNRVYGILTVALPRTLLAHEEEKSGLRLLADALGSVFFRLEFEPETEAGQDQLRQFELLQKALNALPLQMAAWDRQQRLRWCNQTSAQALGAAPETLLDQPWESACPTQPSETVEQERQENRNLLAGLSVPRSLRPAWKPGEDTARWFLTEKKSFPGPDGAPDGWAECSLDVTDYKNAEDELSASESRFRTIFASSPSALLLCDPEGRLTEANQNFKDLFGLAEIRGLRLETLLGDASRSAEIRQDCLAHRRVRFEMTLDFDAQRARGAFPTLRSGAVDLEILIAPFLWQRGSDAPGLLLQIEDISERKLTEEALSENESKYRTIFESSAVGFFLLSDVLADCNNEACRLWACTRQDILGFSPLDLSPEFQPDGRASRESFALYREKALAELPQFFPWQFRRHDGVLIDTELSLKGIAVNGVPHLLMAMRDVTVQKRAEEAYRQAMSRLESLIENTPRVAIQGFDRQGNILHWNKASEKLYGFAAPQAMGRRIQDMLLGGQDRNTFEKALASLWEQGRPSEPREWKIQTQSGETVWVYSSMFPIFENQQVAEVFCIDMDITQRKQTEEALRQSEEKYRTTFENSGTALIILNEDLSIALVNREMENLSGYTQAEILTQRKWHDFVARPEDLEKSLRYHRERRAGAGQVPQSYECSLKHKNGEVHEVILTATLIPSTRQSLVALLDISERKQTEEALRRSEEKYRTTFENSGNALFLSDDDMTVTLVNRKVEELSGYSRKELEGRRRWIEFLVRDEDRVRMTEYHRLRQTQPAAAPQTYECQFKSKQGVIQDILVTVTRMPSVRQSLISLLDITERKAAEARLIESEHRYRLLAENVNDMIWTMDLSRRITYVSPSVASLLGYSIEETVGRVWEETLTPNSARLVSDRRAQGTDGGAAWLQPLELEQTRKDGTAVWTEVRITPILSPEGLIAGYTGVTRDISARKRAEAERSHLEEQLRQSQKMEVIGHLAGGIAHDFNNLLTPILGYADMAAMQAPPGSPLHNDIRVIQETTERAAKLTRQLLAFSLKQVLHMRPVNLNEEIREFLNMLHPLIGEHVELRTELDAGIGLIKADPAQLQQVLMNLAINARDAMPRGGQLVLTTAQAIVDEALAKAHPALKPGDYIRLSVKDSGSGMGPEIINHVFEPFFTTKERGKGTGLGLSMVYGIVTQHGGAIWPESELGRGSIFQVYFPLAEGPLAIAEEPAPVPETTLGGQETILVVEDEPLVRKMAREILVSNGYSVLEFDHPERALEQMSQDAQPVNLLLSDIIMPGMNGKELHRRLALVHPNLKVLFMSGYSEDVIAHHGVLDPDIQLLAKPFSLKGLLRKIREVLDA